ncbi:MAG: DUF4153 domain-containing protein [Clostridiales bacterium]|nr:DUF4153 domain-containing protein [Clostridiales bacterium]
MSIINRSIIRSFKSAVNTVQTFPVSIISAFAFAIVTIVRIQIDWPEQESYNFLFNCLHLSFATSAVFGLATITAVQSRINQKKAFVFANLLSIFIALITFLGLYFIGRETSDHNIFYVSDLAGARVTVLIVVSLIAFVYFAGYPKEQSDFSKSLFMFQKALVIASIYGLVIMGGTYSVATAIRLLLYRGMSGDVYLYLGTIAGFIAFAIFVGYFPDFRKGTEDSHRDVAQKQSRFIEILFEFIMIPIALALTVVLLIWAGKAIVTGTWPEFSIISGIVISYMFGGIWLHLMVTHFHSSLPAFYKRVYPIASFVILMFGLWSFLLRLNESGLKIQEYFFALIWLTAVPIVSLLFIKKDKAHPLLALLICLMSIATILPLVGYHQLPARFQVTYLESILEEEGILVNNQLIPAEEELDKKVRISITESIEFLSYEEYFKLPSWFDEDLGEYEVFKKRLGFEQTWSDWEDRYDDIYEDSISTYLTLPNGTVNITDYDWAVYLTSFSGDRDAQKPVTIDGLNGIYTIKWSVDSQVGIPIVKILLDDEIILEQDLKTYLDQKVELAQANKSNAQSTIEEMSLDLENDQVKLKLVFDHLEVRVDPKRDEIYYWTNLRTLYLKEK